MRKIVLWIIVFFSFVSCSKNSFSKKKIIHICISSDPFSFDTRKSFDLTSSTLSFLLFQGLMELSISNTVQPALAQSYEISKDKKTYTFHLKDAYWSDGQPITAYDFEKSYKSLLHPDFPSPCSSLFFCIKNAKKAKLNTISLDQVPICAQDNSTLVIQLEHPASYFLSLLSFCNFFPMPSHCSQQNFSVCSGPFRIKSQKANRLIVLEKNPYYWNKDRVHADEIHIHIVRNATTAFWLYEQGKIDWLGSPFFHLPSDMLRVIQKRQDLQTQAIAGCRFCTFNTQAYPFFNKNLRKAFALAISRADLQKHFPEPIATRLIPPPLGLQQKSLQKQDINRARELFQIALMEMQIEKQNLDLTFCYNNNLYEKKIAETLKQYWEKAFDISIHLQAMERKVYLQCLHDHQYQFGLGCFIAQYPDAMSILERFTDKNLSKNLPAWEKDTYVQLIECAVKETSEKKRMDYLLQAEDLFLEDYPLFMLFQVQYSALIKPHLLHAKFGLFGDVHLDEIMIHDKERL